MTHTASDMHDDSESTAPLKPEALEAAPCPFCGSADKPKLFDFDGEPYVPGFEIRCDASGWDGMDGKGCGATSGWAETPAEALEAWNRRAPLEASRAPQEQGVKVKDCTPEFDEMVAADPLLAKAASIICGAACGMYSACNSREAAVALRDAGLLPLSGSALQELAAWAVERWNAEVKNRPLVNVHRRSLDDAWRQVIRHFDGDPDALCGPSHDELLCAKEVGE